MLIKFFGWFWIVAGILFLCKPLLLKNRLQKKSLKKIRKYLFLLAVLLGSLLIAVSRNFQGFSAKIVMFLGIVGIFKGFFLLKGKIADKMIQWFIAQPLIFFRMGACLYIIVGITILKLH